MWDSAYVQVESNIGAAAALQAQYKEQALEVRDTVTYLKSTGGAC